MIIPTIDTEPFFINPEGTKWWKSEDLTAWAQRPDINGVKLDMVCCILETVNKYRTFVLINTNNEIVYESQQAEGSACHIDMRKVLKYRDD